MGVYIAQLASSRESLLRREREYIRVYREKCKLYGLLWNHSWSQAAVLKRNILSIVSCLR